MKVILQQDVSGKGKRGQLVEVAEGYARNYLLPRKLAVLATADAVNTMQLREKAKKAEDARLKAEAATTPEQSEAEAEAVSAKLKNSPVKVTARAGANGKLFGAVTGKEVSDALKEQYGIELAKQKIVLDAPIKAYGNYELKAKLGYEVSGTIYVMVVEEK